MSDGRHARRAGNKQRALDHAVVRLSTGERVTAEVVARDAQLSVRSVYRYWPTNAALVEAAGAGLIDSLTKGAPFPNGHQKVLRSPTVAAAIMVAAKDDGLDPSKTFRQIDNAARLCEQRTGN